MSALSPQRDEVVLVENPLWHYGDTFVLSDVLSPLASFTSEEFREYLRMHRIAETCDIANRLPEEAKDGNPFFGRNRVYNNFCTYLYSIISVLMTARKTDLLDIFMQLPLPFNKHFWCQIIRGFWIEESAIHYIELYLQQGHTLHELRGQVEEAIAENGVIDVLDFFLQHETEENRIFENSIVYFASLNKNVDILDRILVRGYPVNESTYTEDFYDNEGPQLPLYAAVEPPLNDTSSLDRLLMFGVDVNLRAEKRGSALMYALLLDNIACFERLFEVGCKVDNELDLVSCFVYYTPTEEILDKLVAAGMDLNYRTKEGTPRYMIEKRLEEWSDPDSLALSQLLQKEKYGVDYVTPLEERLPS